MEDLTILLRRIEGGDSDAVDSLFELVYSELRKLASIKLWREKNDNVQVTELVNESYLRLVDKNGAMNFECRKHFFGAASEAMRRILVDDARTRNAQKRGGGREKVSLRDTLSITPSLEQVLAVDDAIDSLAELNPAAAQLVKLRFFVGMTQKKAGEALGMSEDATVTLWKKAKTWLYRELRNE